MKNAISLLVATTLTSCTYAATEIQETSGNPALVYIAQMCSPETKVSARRIFQSSDLSVSHGVIGELCIDTTSPKIEFENNSMRLYFYKSGRTAVRLSCVDAVSASSFYKNNNNKQVALVSDSKAIAIFTALTPDEVAKCGEFSSVVPEDTLALCEGIAVEWATDLNGCYKMCNSAENATNEGVCAATQTHE